MIRDILIVTGSIIVAWSLVCAFLLVCASISSSIESKRREAAGIEE